MTDEDLIRDIQSGDIVAFEILVKKYQRPLFSFTSKFVSDPHSVEDIAQESFFKIYKSIEKIDPKKKFSTYAFEITKNTAIDYLRKNKKQISLNDLELPIEDAHYERLIRDDRRNVIRKAFSKINPKYKKVLGLYYFDELSYEEIAGKMKVPVNTVRTWLSRGKLALRQVLEK